MRLIKFLSYSNDDKDVLRFRSMRIGLTKVKVDNSKILEEIYKRYDIEKIEPILENINKELRKFYNGKYFYDLVITEEKNKKINEISDNKKRTEAMSISLYEANDKLSKLKGKVEKIIKDSLQST
jgi:hypothetical protein